MTEKLNETVSAREGITKKFLYINRRAPHGSNYAQEGLEVALMGAAFDQIVTMAFIDDGIFQLKKGQDTKEIGTWNFSVTFKALGDYEVQKVYVERESMMKRGLDESDLIPLVYEDEDDDWEEKPLIHIVDEKQMRDIIDDNDVILNF